MMPRKSSNRSFGDAPVLGKVPRSPQSAVRDSGHLRTRSSRRLRNARRKVLAWSLLLSITAAGVLIAFTVMFFSKARSGNGMRKDAIASPSETAESTTGLVKKTELPSLGKSEARKLVVAAMGNREPSKVGNYFRLATGTAPGTVIGSLESIERTEGEIIRYEAAPALYANGTLMERVIVHLGADGKEVNRLAQLIPSEDGVWKIDFDSYMRASDPDWRTILSGKSGQATVRVFIAPDNYYNNLYADDSVWQAYAMVSPDTETVMLGYVRIGSPQHLAVESILKSEQSLHRATFRLARKGTEETRQFEIISVLAEDWVTGETPFDESFR